MTLPVPLKSFVAKHVKGTPDEVWTKVLSIYHGDDRLTMDEWKEKLEALRVKPVVHPAR